MAIKWNTFLTDGFEDWWPAATVAAFQTTKPDPRVIIQGMIARFLFPESTGQSVDDIEAKIESIAIAHNARYRDPKTGKVIGTIRQVKRGNKPPRNPEAAKKKMRRLNVRPGVKR